MFNSILRSTKKETANVKKYKGKVMMISESNPYDKYIRKKCSKSGVIKK